MNINIDWVQVKKSYEDEMSDKLNTMPGHRDVLKELLEFRAMISHDMPETAPKELFHKLIGILLKGKRVDLAEMKREYLNPAVENEEEVLNSHKMEFLDLKDSAEEWIEFNLSEEELQRQWKNHETWLPRRYGIYEDPNLPFQKIATDTLTRFYLIKNMSNNVKS